jgi:hypothetical protein
MWVSERKLTGQVVELAEKNHDGHVCFMKFTTGWKVVFGTPHNLTPTMRDVLETMPGKMLLRKAMEFALIHEPFFEWDCNRDAKGLRDFT